MKSSLLKKAERVTPVDAVVYHGTKSEFDAFRLGPEGLLWFSTDIEFAKQWGPRVIKARVKIDNPDIYDGGGMHMAAFDEKEDVDEWKEEGYDGVAVTNPGMPTNYAVISLDQVEWLGEVEPLTKKANTLTVYHGSSEKFKSFKGGRSLHFTDSKAVAKSYATGYMRTGSGYLYTVQLTMDDPIDIRKPGETERIYEETGEWIDADSILDPETFADVDLEMYDGVIAYSEVGGGMRDGATEYIVWNPGQAKIMKVEPLNQKKASAVVDTPAFKAWFAGSKVVDEAGLPQMVFHGTMEDFDEFKSGDIGFHVGTNEQAEKRLSVRTQMNPKGVGQIMPLYACIKNPLKILDFGNWQDPWEMYEAANVATGGKLSPIAPDINAALWNGFSSDPEDRIEDRDLARKENGSAALRVIREAIEALGYDGMVYPNEYEGEGTSWVCFKPNQVKSAIGNGGGFDAASNSIMASSEVAWVPREDTIKGGYRASVGTKRIGREGYVDILTELPISDLVMPEGNTLYPQTLNKYQDKGDNDYPVVIPDEGKYIVDDGNHRVEAERRNGNSTVRVWLRQPEVSTERTQDLEQWYINHAKGKNASTFGPVIPATDADLETAITWAGLAKSMANGIKQNKGLGLNFAVHSGELCVGVMKMDIMRQYDAKEYPVASIDYMAVDPNFQRQGIGKKMTQFAIDTAREAGVSLRTEAQIALGDKDNPNTPEDYWKAQGFSDKGRRKFVMPVNKMKTAAISPEDRTFYHGTDSEEEFEEVKPYAPSSRDPFIWLGELDTAKNLYSKTTQGKGPSRTFEVKLKPGTRLADLTNPDDPFYKKFEAHLGGTSDYEWTSAYGSVHRNERWLLENLMKDGYAGVIVNDRAKGRWDAKTTFHQSVALADMNAIESQTKIASPLHNEAMDTTFYHGTGSTKAANAIIAGGIAPREISMPDQAKSKAHLAPAKGRVYVTPDLLYAAVYALGGNIFGHESYLKYLDLKRNPDAEYGYIFAMKGSDLQGDVAPDEDSLGGVLCDLFEYQEAKETLEKLEKTNGAPLNKYQPNTPEAAEARLRYAKVEVDRAQQSKINQPSTPESVRDNLVTAAHYFLTPKQKGNLTSGEISHQAQIGKKLQKHLSNSTIKWFIDQGFHVAHLGVIHPTKAWRFKRAEAFTIPKADVMSICEEIPLTNKTAAMSEEDLIPFVAVDLDGTLARNIEGNDYFDPTLIGEPIPEMIERVQDALEAGEDVRVFTARLADEENADLIREAIFDWTEEHVGVGLIALNEKLPGMTELWDDRAKGVIENTGKFAAGRKVPAEDLVASPEPSNTLSPELSKWFKGSVVVDDNDNPRIVYHGSRVPWLVQFDMDKEGSGVVSNSKNGAIWFTSNRDNASWYADYTDKLEASTQDPNVYGEEGSFYALVEPVDAGEEDLTSLFTVGPFPTEEEAEEEALKQADLYNEMLHEDTFVNSAYLRITNPLIVDVVPRHNEFEAAKAGGYDGIIAIDVVDGVEPSDIYVVFSPRQIRSADDRRQYRHARKSSREPLTKIPPELESLAAEARKCSTFEDFKDDFLFQIKHGRYWHITHDPNFTVDPSKGPRDMSSMADNKEVPGGLMFTSDFRNWDGYYNFNDDDERENSREYAALLDLSQVDREDYGQVGRGFGNEFYIENAAKVRVVEVLPIEAAEAKATQYANLLDRYITNVADIRNFWELAKNPSFSAKSSSLTTQYRKASGPVNITPEGRYGNYQLSIDSHDTKENEFWGDPVYDVTATLDGKMVAKAEVRDDGDYLYPEDIWVAATHRRKGLATALYQFAEQEAEKPLHPSDQQTNDAQRLWSQPGRSFGDKDAAATPKLTFNTERQSGLLRINAEAQGTWAGCVGIDDQEDDGKQWRVESVVVDDKWRGKGVGVALYSKAVELARKAGAKFFTSDFDRSDESERIWKRMGDKFDVQFSGERHYIKLAGSSKMAKDFGYSKYNDREEDIKQVRWRSKPYHRTGYIIEARFDSDKIGEITCDFYAKGDGGNNNGEPVVYSSVVDVLDPSWRGTGLGQMLYDKAIAKAKKLGALWFCSDTSLTSAAVSAWKKLKNRYPVEELPGEAIPSDDDAEDENIPAYRIDLRKVTKKASAFSMSPGDHTVKMGDARLVYKVIPDKSLIELYSLKVAQKNRRKGAAGDENDFLKQHNTGWISSDTYSRSDMFSGTEVADYPKLLDTLTLKNGQKIELRQTGETNRYVKPDNDGYASRDHEGHTIYLNEDEMREKKLPLEDTSIQAFNDKGECVGIASDEWGADGIWVKEEYQGFGIGTALLKALRRQFSKVRTIGQMTDAGQNLTRSYYRDLTGKEPDASQMRRYDLVYDLLDKSKLDETELTELSDLQNEAHKSGRNPNTSIQKLIQWAWNKRALTYEAREAAFASKTASVIGPVYHGTTYDFEEFGKNKGLRSGFLGSVNEVDVHAFFFTEDKRQARAYAQNRQLHTKQPARVIEAYLTIHHLLDFTDPNWYMQKIEMPPLPLHHQPQSTRSDPDDLYEEYEDTLEDSGGLLGYLINYLLVDTMSEQDWNDLGINPGLAEPDETFTAWPLFDNKKVTEALRYMGYDGFKVTEGEDAEFGGWSYAVTSPSQVRIVKSVKVGSYPEPITSIPSGLEPLADEARKCDSAEQWKKDFLQQIKHGKYWHVTHNPDFKIDPSKGPRDMSSMAGNGADPGALMFTSDFRNWDWYYNFNDDDERENSREYAALLDLSQVDREDYGQVGRGFGNEFYLEDASTVRIVRVMPIEAAEAEDNQYRNLLGRYIYNEGSLRRFWEVATGNISEDTSKQAAMSEELLAPVIAVDLDGTLAQSLEDYSDPTVIGAPIPAMIEKIQYLLEQGEKVVIFTARMADEENADRIAQAIFDYTEEHIGVGLEATNQKIPGMKRFIDDKARQVEENTGEFKVATAFPMTEGYHAVRHEGAKLEYKVITKDNLVQLYSLRVAQKNRRKGSARRAMNAFLTAADGAGLRAWLCASTLDKKTNTAGLINFYASLGFVETGEKVNMLGDPVMERPLNKEIKLASYVVGNCVTSFDDDGECILQELPWGTVSDFAGSVEELGDNFELEGIQVDYDEDTDIHTFTKVARPTDAKIKLLADQMKLTPEQVEAVIETDPSPNQTDFVTWIAKNVSKNLIRLPEDSERIKEQLTRFMKTKRSPDFTGNKDINSYTPQTLYTLVGNAEAAPVSNKEKQRQVVEAGSKVILNKEGYKVYKVTDAAALSILSYGTNWCTVNENTAKNYLDDGPSYVIFEDGSAYGQLHPASDQFMDRSDNAFHEVIDHNVGPGQLRESSNVLLDETALHVVRMLAATEPEVAEWFKEYDHPMEDIRKHLDTSQYANTTKDVQRALLDKTPLPPEREATLEGEVSVALMTKYGVAFHKGAPWKPLEDVLIGQNEPARELLTYARKFMNGNWPAGDTMVLNHVPNRNYNSDLWNTMALEWAAGIKKGSWPELEAKLSKKVLNPQDLDKAKINNPNGHPGEEESYTGGKLALRYCNEVINARWPNHGNDSVEEGMVYTGTLSSLLPYAENYIKAPWEPLKSKLIKLCDSRYGVYSEQIHQLIDYCTKVSHQREPEFESIMLESKNVVSEAIPKYAIKVIKGPWSEYEKAISKVFRNDTEYYSYPFDHKVRGLLTYMDFTGKRAKPVDDALVSSIQQLEAKAVASLDKNGLNFATNVAVDELRPARIWLHEYCYHARSAGDPWPEGEKLANGRIESIERTLTMMGDEILDSPVWESGNVPRNVMSELSNRLISNLEEYLESLTYGDEWWDEGEALLRRAISVEEKASKKGYPDSLRFERILKNRKERQKTSSSNLSKDYPNILRDSTEIAEYVQALSTYDVSTEMIEELYHGCHATLELVDIGTLREGSSDGNIADPEKEKAYAKMNGDTAPPILVDDGEVKDGNHRLREAKDRGDTSIWAYVISGDEEGWDKTSASREDINQLDISVSGGALSFQADAMNAEDQEVGVIRCAVFDQDTEMTGDAEDPWDIHQEDQDEYDEGIHHGLEYAVFDAQVQPEWLGIGLGQSLYDLLIAEAKRRGAKYLWSDEDQSPAGRQAWERLSKRYTVKYMGDMNRWRLDVGSAKGKKASPNFDYTTFNDKEEELATLKWDVRIYPSHFNINVFHPKQRNELHEPLRVAYLVAEKISDTGQARPSPRNPKPAETDISTWNDYCLAQSRVLDLWKGTGLGQLLYDRAVDEAKNLGATALLSDTKRTAEADKAWERLGRRYDVELKSYPDQKTRYRLSLKTASYNGDMNGTHHKKAKFLRKVSGSSDIEKTMNRAVKALAFHNIPCLVAGGYAVQENGYARFTQDVDLIVPDVSVAKSWLSISGFKENPGSSMTVTDRVTKVEVDLLPGGGSVGPGPLALPMPTVVSESPQILDLRTLIETKLSSYIGNNIHRNKDLSDVVELMKANHPPRDLGVAEEVRAEYEKTWDALNPETKTAYYVKKPKLRLKPPATVYHGTTHAFDTFDLSEASPLGIHFGTLGQARFMAKHGTGDTPRVIAAHINVTNPLEMHDTGFYDAEVMIAFSDELKAISEEDKTRFNKLSTVIDVKNYLISQGYDGVTYRNRTAEGRGRSFIVFNLDQINVINPDLEPKTPKTAAGIPDIEALIAQGMQSPTDSETMERDYDSLIERFDQPTVHVYRSMDPVQGVGSLTCNTPASLWSTVEPAIPTKHWVVQASIDRESVDWFKTLTSNLHPDTKKQQAVYLKTGSEVRIEAYRTQEGGAMWNKHAATINSRRSTAKTARHSERVHFGYYGTTSKFAGFENEWVWVHGEPTEAIAEATTSEPALLLNCKVELLRPFIVDTPFNEHEYHVMLARNAVVAGFDGVVIECEGKRKVVAFSKKNVEIVDRNVIG